MIGGSLRTETQTSPVANSNVIPFERRTEPLKKAAIHHTDHSGHAGELNRSLMEHTVSPLLVPVKSHSAVRQDKVERIRQRLLTGLYNVDAGQIARSMLKRQLGSSLLRHEN
jgi:anti-sigma28 factor (negative regulator of flagellin synthesis)